MNVVVDPNEELPDSTSAHFTRTAQLASAQLFEETRGITYRGNIRASVVLRIPQNQSEHVTEHPFVLTAEHRSTQYMTLVHHTVAVSNHTRTRCTLLPWAHPRSLSSCSAVRR